jgi:hypothetical protein
VGDRSVVGDQGWWPHDSSTDDGAVLRSGDLPPTERGWSVNRRRIVPIVAVVLAGVVILTSCKYTALTTKARNEGQPIPWWCHPTEEIPVTQGPAVGTVDWYAGTHKSALSWDDCVALSKQFDAARAYVQKWPTAAAAEADGWGVATPYVPGMGTHHVLNGITPAELNDPGFDRNNPILDDMGLDDVFDPARPEVLQFSDNTPSGRLVGFDYYVRTTTGLPPEGLPGNNDWWHHHPKICFRKTDAAMIGFNVSDSSCTSTNGINVNMSNYYMLHVWVLDDMTFQPDVYAGMIPCITGGTAIFDQGHWCHTSRSGSAGASADLHAGHEMLPS